jgi:hypothetical protein
VRHVPIRWVELHAPHHPECQNSSGISFRGPLPATHPGTWRSSAWLYWMIDRLNRVYSETGIDFWLQAHDVFCTDTVARWEGNEDTPYTWSEVRNDLYMLFPHAQLHDFGAEELPRKRWLEKAFILYGDPHGLTLLIHNDHQSGTSGTRIQPDILPQHGFGPWYTPGVVFMFLSGMTWAPGWEFDPELTVAHEIGHSLGNCHTLDFDKFCVGPGGNGDAIFPDTSAYAWTDHWDLAYVDSAAGVQGFSSRGEAGAWIAANGLSQLRRIDDQSNITLSQSDGEATATLSTNPSTTVQSGTLVPGVSSGVVRLLQALSFDFSYFGGMVPTEYLWQRNVMSYRYKEVDPYDYLTARFSRSQIEVMQRQLQGSTPFVSSIHGTRPPGTESWFASRYQFRGDGKTYPFVWYSNGEGPDTVPLVDALPDMVAFRSAPAGNIVNGTYTAGDFNGDGLTDLMTFLATGGARFLWSRVDSEDGIHLVHHWDEETVGELGIVTIAFSGDFDANGADDLFVSADGSGRVLYFKSGTRECGRFSSCLSHVVDMNLAIDGPVAVGNFDGRGGDDFVWSSYADGVTYAEIRWSSEDGTFKDSRRRVGKARYAPHAGNFNGTDGDDVMWYDPSADQQIFWWGSKGGPNSLAAASHFRGIGNPIVAGLTVGDFDGNGADDLMIRDSHEPGIFFSIPGQQQAYQAHFTRLDIALRNSHEYLTAVGEFDNATRADGTRLGDDILLYYGPPFQQ